MYGARRGNRHIARFAQRALVLSFFLKPNKFLEGELARLRDGEQARHHSGNQTGETDEVPLQAHCGRAGDRPRAGMAMQAAAADIQERRVKFSYPVSKTNPVGLVTDKFIELVGQKTGGGKIKVTGYADAQLKQRDPGHVVGSRAASSS